MIAYHLHWSRRPYPKI